MHFPNLEEINLEDTHIWSSADDFWETMSLCTQLKRIYLNKFKIYNEFFDFNKQTIDNALGKRKTPFVIHFYKTGHEDMVSTFFP